MKTESFCKVNQKNHLNFRQGGLRNSID